MTKLIKSVFNTLHKSKYRHRFNDTNAMLKNWNFISNNKKLDNQPTQIAIMPIVAMSKDIDYEKLIEEFLKAVEEYNQ